MFLSQVWASAFASLAGLQDQAQASVPINQQCINHCITGKTKEAS
jgi:hypothetical protein